MRSEYLTQVTSSAKTRSAAAISIYCYTYQCQYRHRYKYRTGPLPPQEFSRSRVSRRGDPKVREAVPS